MRLRNWEEQNPAEAARVTRACREEMGAPDHYLILEAFIVKKATYTLKKDGGAAIELTTPDAIKKFLTIEGNVKYKNTREGKLEVEQPVVFAIKRAVRIRGTGVIQPLGDMQGEITADARLREFFLEGATMKVKSKTK